MLSLTCSQHLLFSEPPPQNPVKNKKVSLGNLHVSISKKNSSNGSSRYLRNGKWVPCGERFRAKSVDSETDTNTTTRSSQESPGVSDNGGNPSTSFLSLLCPLLRLFTGGDPSQERNSFLEVATSSLSTLARYPWGSRPLSSSLGSQQITTEDSQKMPLQLYEFEACPFCRRVREALTELDLSVEVYPCPKGSLRHRAVVKTFGGKEQFPFLVDPNTGISMYESGLQASSNLNMDNKLRLEKWGFKAVHVGKLSYCQVKHLLEMLVKKCGLEAVKAVMPEEHMKLLTNIRKIKERKERRISSNSEDEARSRLSRASTSRLSGWNHTKVFSDFGDDDSEGSDAVYMEATTVTGHSRAAQSKPSSLRSRRTHRAAKNLPEDLSAQLGDDPLDLLDQQKTRSALRSSGHLKRKPESDDEPEIDSEGRLVIREEGKPKKRESPADPGMDVRSQVSSHLSSKTSKQTQKKRRKTSETGCAYTGNEYSSKKAGGDVKRKGKLEPYAYWPLDRKMLSRRPEHRVAARKGIASVVKMTKQLEGKSASNALSVRGLKLKRNQQKFKRNQKKGHQ